MQKGRNYLVRQRCSYYTQSKLRLLDMFSKVVECIDSFTSLRCLLLVPHSICSIGDIFQQDMSGVFPMEHPASADTVVMQEGIPKREIIPPIHVDLWLILEQPAISLGCRSSVDLICDRGIDFGPRIWVGRQADRLCV